MKKKKCQTIDYLACIDNLENVDLVVTMDGVEKLDHKK